MTDILIKSFNRPYYLDRCLQSIYRHVNGDFKITIMDDGTPEQYLIKILHAYPNIEMNRSSNHAEKSKLVQQPYTNPTEIQQQIPVELWKNCVKKSSNVFLLLEEDSWFTESIDLRDTLNHINQHKLNIVKLGWNGNPQVVDGESISLSNTINEIKPQLPVSNPIILSHLLKNTFKIRSVLFKTKILPTHFLLPYYSLYTVTSAFFNKIYWLHLWSTSQQRVDEMLQLLKAFEWSKQTGGRYGKYYTEVVKTSFLTSSNQSGSIKGLNMNAINHHLNEAWMNNSLDPMKHYPKDFSISYFKNILAEREMSPQQITAWICWIEWFQKMHLSIGNEVN
jgi:hypothetical protein